MRFSARRRGIAGVLVAAVIALAGCTVPGQPAPAGAAAAFEQATISNERVSDLYDAWREEAAQPTSRRSVVTLELLREPLIAAAEELGLNHHRSHVQQHAQVLLRMQGSNSAPSETLIDAVEGAYLVAMFAMTPELGERLVLIAAQVEAGAVTSPRTGDFNAQLFLQSLGPANEQANSLYNQNMPAYFVAYRSVNGFTVAGAEWLATDSATTQ